MAYGADVRVPMEVPQEPPSYFAQVPAELPVMKDATVGTLRLEGTLAKRLPPMPSGELQDLSFTNSKQLEAMELMAGIRNAYGISRHYDRRSKAKAKAVAHQNDRQLKNAGSQGKRNIRKMQGQTKRAEKSTVLRNARDVLGMGTSTYR